MDKENVYTYKGILCSLEENPVTYYNMDKPGGHYAKQNKQSQKDTYYIIPAIWNI